MDKNIPVVATWLHEGKLVHVGSKHALATFSGANDELKSVLTSAMCKDILENCEIDNSHPIGNTTREKSATVVFHEVVNSSPSGGSSALHLPMELYIMNQKEKSKYISDVIAHEAALKKI